MKNIVNLEFVEKASWCDSLIFRDNNSGCKIYIESFKNGNVRLSSFLGSTINDVAKIAEGMLYKESNATYEINTAFEINPIQSIDTVSFDFNEVLITASADTSEDDMVRQLYDGYEKQSEKRKAEYEEYKKTPQYAIDMEIQRKKEIERAALTKEIKHIDETTELEFEDNEAKNNWEKFVEVNSKDGYSSGVVNYARMWAKYMQHKISKGENLIDIADSTSHAADIDGITGFMYGCAVNALSQMWKYGEDLRKWHNKE